MKVDRIHAVHVEDSIDNRRVVRSRDDRMPKDLLWIGGVVLVVIALLVAYGWPRAALRDAGSTAGRLQREFETLQEENRQLRLEKASLQDLNRIQKIANDQLGLRSPAPSSVIIVEAPQNLPKDSQVAARTVVSERQP